MCVVSFDGGRVPPHHHRGRRRRSRPFRRRRKMRLRVQWRGRRAWTTSAPPSAALPRRPPRPRAWYSVRSSALALVWSKALTLTPPPFSPTLQLHLVVVRSLSTRLLLRGLLPGRRPHPQRPRPHALLGGVIRAPPLRWHNLQCATIRDEAWTGAQRRACVPAHTVRPKCERCWWSTGRPGRHARSIGGTYLLAVPHRA